MYKYIVHVYFQKKYVQNTIWNPWTLTLTGTETYSSNDEIFSSRRCRNGWNNHSEIKSSVPKDTILNGRLLRSPENVETGMLSFWMMSVTYILVSKFFKRPTNHWICWTREVSGIAWKEDIFRYCISPFPDYLFILLLVGRPVVLLLK